MNLKHLGFGNFLEEEEKIYSVFRHPISMTFLKVLFNLIIWGAAAWAIHFYLNNYYYDYDVTNIYSWIFLIPAFIGLIKSFNIFMKWYANSILMTSESLVFAEFTHIFDRRASRINYWDLDDVELEKKGVSDYLGNRGDLLFSKVSGGAAIEFKRVNNPRRIIRKIRKHKSNMLNEKNFSEEGALKDLLSQMVQTHVRGKGQPDEHREIHIEKLIEKKVAEKEIPKEEYFNESDFIRMKKEELVKLRKLAEFHGEEIDESIGDENLIEVENPAKLSTKDSLLDSFTKKIKERHFHNELEDDDFINHVNIEVEKELDDEGGLEIEL